MRALPLLAAGALVLVLAGAAGGTGPRGLDPSTPKQAFVTNGSVAVVVDTGTTTYIGGTFSEVGPRTGPAVAISASNDSSFTSAQVSGGGNTVYAVASDNSGGYYVGGDFSHVGGLVRHDLAHVLASGQVDPAFDPEPNNDVMAIAVSGSTVYVGGEFTSIGGQSRSRIAALSSSGTPTTWNPGADATVRALAVSGSTVYAGGDFNNVNGNVQRFFAAALDATSGTATSWDPHPSSTVYAIVVAGPTVYLAGAFTAINWNGATFLASRNRIAAVNDTDGTVTTWAPAGADNSVYTIALSSDGTTLYCGGIFLHMSGALQHGAAALSTADGSLTGWNPSPFFAVAALTVSGNTLYAGGAFGSMSGQTRSGLAAFDTTDPTNPSLTSWDPNAGNEVLALAATSSTVYAGGIFSSVNLVARNYLAAINDSTGEVTSWDPEPNFWVLSLAATGSHVWAGGIFSEIGGQARQYVAELNPNTGAAETSWNADIQAMTGGEVNAIVPSGAGVFIGGVFTIVDGQSRLYLAELDSTGAPVTSWEPSANDQVTALALSGSTLYVGGAFTDLGDEARYHLAAVDASTGALLSWDPEANNTVEAVAASPTGVYVGGDFTTVGGQPRKFLAALDPSTGLATDWNPSPDGGVQAIAASGSNVFVGGQFSEIGGATRGYLADIDPGTGNAKTFDPEPNSVVAALATAGTRLDVAGSFTSFDLGANQGFAAFDIPPSLTVAKTGTGAGTVSSAPNGILCGATCTADFAAGTAVTLAASPNAGSTFAGWSGGGCSGTGACHVTLNADTTVNATFTFPAPSISGFSPLKGNAGDTVTVNGSNLSSATSVKLAGVSATFTPVSAGQLTLVVPNGASSGHISVTTPGGTAVSPNAFTILAAAPSVTTFAPGQGAPGASISVKGFHFTGATGVNFNGTPAVFAVITDNLITASVPVGAATGKIAVTSAGGTGTSPSSFTVLPAAPPVPTITSFSPGSGITGVAVMIKGSGFTGATAVKFNGKSASYSVVNDTTIKAIVPPLATTGPIAVTTPGGVATSAAIFNVV